MLKESMRRNHVTTGLLALIAVFLVLILIRPMLLALVVHAQNRWPYGKSPKTTKCPLAPTYTLPFAIVGTTNFTVEPN